MLKDTAKQRFLWHHGLKLYLLVLDGFSSILCFSYFPFQGHGLNLILTVPYHFFLLERNSSPTIFMYFLLVFYYCDFFPVTLFPVIFFRAFSSVTFFPVTFFPSADKTTPKRQNYDVSWALIV